MAYADLLKVNRDWTYKQFEAAQRSIIRQKLRAYDLMGMGTPVWSAHQVIDGKRRIFFANRPNKFTANFFNTLSCFLEWPGSADYSTAVVDNTGTVDSTYNAALITTSRVMNLIGQGAGWPANKILGTDTATASTRLMWETTSGITHNAPSSTTATNTNSSVSWQASKTANQYSQENIAIAFAANATSGNPTLGEVMGFGVISSTSTPTYVSAAFSRLAAADGVFSAFTVTSSAALTLNWQINWPTT